MHWEESFIVGGVERNRSGYLRSASALQTVLQLMGEKELFDYWDTDYKVMLNAFQNLNNNIFRFKTWAGH